MPVTPEDARRLVVVVLHVIDGSRQVARALSRLPPPVVEHEGGQQEEESGQADQQHHQPRRALHLGQVGLDRDGEAGAGQGQIDGGREVSGPGEADRSNLHLEVLC